MAVSMFHKFCVKDNGHTLPEILIVGFLGLLLLTFIAQIYFSAKTSHKIQFALERVQENGRFAVNLLNHDIRMAGYINCGIGKGLISKNLIVKGYDGSNPPDYLKGQVKQGTDVVVIGKCKNIYGHEKFMGVGYFIGDTYRKNKSGETVYGLFEKRSGEGGRRQELVANVNDMQISYGVREDEQRGIEKYVGSNKVSNWNNVAGVHIILLLSSLDNVFNKPKYYIFNGRKIQNKRLMKEWITYISLREIQY